MGTSKQEEPSQQPAQPDSTPKKARGGRLKITPKKDFRFQYAGKVYDLVKGKEEQVPVEIETNLKTEGVL